METWIEFLAPNVNPDSDLVFAEDLGNEPAEENVFILFLTLSLTKIKLKFNNVTPDFMQEQTK